MSGALAVIVFGVSYAAVPLYKMFCQVTNCGPSLPMYSRSLVLEEQLNEQEQPRQFLSNLSPEDES
jgi:cytochrome c oxidase assembly protein Cox11